MRPAPLSEPSAAANAMDSVSTFVRPLLASEIVTPENGMTVASEAVVWFATVPEIIGATAGSLSITVVVLSGTAPGDRIRQVQREASRRRGVGHADRREDQGVERGGDRRRRAHQAVTAARAHEAGAAQR